MSVRLVPFVAVFAGLFAAIACTSDSPPRVEPTAVQDPVAPSESPSATETPGITAVDIADEVLSVLQARGVQIGDVESENVRRPGNNAKFALIDDEDWILISSYSNAHFAATEAASMRLMENVVLDPDAFGYGLESGDRGRFVFLLGDSVIEYSGDDPVVTDTIRNLGAGLFMGGILPLFGGADALMQIFRDRDFEVSEADQFALGLKMPTGHRSKFFFVNGEEVHVWAYPPSQYRIGGGGISELIRTISNDGMSAAQGEGITRFDWQGTPHFFSQAGAVALYVGDNAAIVGLMREVAGREFAGGNLDEAYPVTTDLLQTSLEELGLSVEPQETSPSNSPFNTPGELWLLNGESVEVFVFRGPSNRPYGVDFRDRRGLWPTTPHLFERENAAVFYVGEDEIVITALEELFGWNEMATGVPPAVRMGIAAGEQELAPVADVQVYSRQPYASGMVALITAQNGGCVVYDHYTFAVEANRVVVSVFNRDTSTAWKSHDDDVVRACTLDLRSHRIYVPLEEGLNPGSEYILEINGESRATFVAE